jgi:hypothetical protein
VVVENWRWKKVVKRAKAGNRKSFGKCWLLELTHAIKMSLRFAGKTDAVILFSEVLETTPTRASRLRKHWDAHAKNVVHHILQEKHSLCSLKLIWQKFNIQNFEVKQKLRTAKSTQVTT